MPGKPCCDGTRVFACALVTGLLVASLTGLQAGQSLDGGGPPTGVQFGFAPAAALFGFVAGALVGTPVGLLWGRPGVAGLLGMALVAGLGALGGLEVAGLAGAESRTVVEGNAVGTEYGPRPGVLAAGAAGGAAIGAVIAWRFRPRPAPASRAMSPGG
jgi:hypothetical protein